MEELEEHLSQVLSATPHNPFVFPNTDAHDIVQMAIMCPVLENAYNASKVVQQFMENDLKIEDSIMVLLKLC